MSDEERLDSAGHRVGRRASGPHGLPKRNESGLCPGLEAGLSEVADDLHRLAETIDALSKDGVIGSEGVREWLQSLEAKARGTLNEWAPDAAASSPVEGDPK